MTSHGRILIVDDDPAFIETYKDLLAAEGYTVETVTTYAAALRRLDEPGWSVVLLDQKLRGPGGPDTGLDLIVEARSRAPGAKVLLVTAYASNEAVERAFREGAYEYLEKSPIFEAMLHVKVRNAMEAVSERWLATLDLDGTELAIRETWAAAQAASDGNKRGVLLERLVALLLKSIPGFDRLDTRLRNSVEELDVLVQNGSTDPFWQKESPYILVECKNWSTHIGAKELRDLWVKMEGRYNRCRLALLIAPGGFSESVREHQLRKSENDMLVVLIGAGDLDDLIRCKDRSEALKEMHRRAVAAAFDRKDDEEPSPRH
jgi:CheY-like chemotaxis protein